MRTDAAARGDELPPLVHEVIRQVEAQRTESRNQWQALSPTAELPALVHEVIRQLEAQRHELSTLEGLPPLVQAVNEHLETQRSEFGPLIDQLNGLLRRQGEHLGPALQRQAEQLLRMGELMGERDEQLQRMHLLASERNSQITDLTNRQARLELKHRQVEEERARLQAVVAERDAQVADAGTVAELARQEIAAREVHAQALRDSLAQRNVEFRQLAARAEETGRHAAECEYRIVEQQEQIAAQQEQVAAQQEQIGAHEAHIAALEQTVADAGRHIDQQLAMLAAQGDHVRLLEQTVADGATHISQQQDMLAAQGEHVRVLEQTVSDATRHIDQLRDILAEREDRLAEMHRTLQHTRKDLDEAREKIQQLLGSRSWKVTRPLRAVNAMLNRGKAPRAAGVAPALQEPFDREWYLKSNEDVARSGMDPYQHYLLSGKQEGRRPLPPPFLERQMARLKPGGDAAAKPAKAKVATGDRAPIVTDDFDEAFYLRYYPDIARSGVDPYEHFKNHGQAEGRFGKLPPLDLVPGRVPFDPARETVLVVSHEASRTGAPILSLNIGQGLGRKYNVVSLLLGGGPMVDAFLQESSYIVGPVKLRDETMKATLLIEQLVAALPLKFAITNSIESRWALEPLSRLGVPTVSLIHEFAAYTRPRNAFRDAIYWAGETVFSTPLTCENALHEFPELSDQSFAIAAQGRCLLVAEETDEASIEREDTRVRGRLRPGGERDDAIVVIGAGFVQQRKGVDLFIDIAAKVLASPGGRRFRFVWVGKGYDPENDLGYSVYLADQLRRHGLERDIVFMDETSRIETVYAATDILLLSSRLDPLPNVAIDAMAHGLPVVCFENTTGIATVFEEAGLADACVARYLDTADAADKLLRLAGDPALRADVGARSRAVVEERFDMDRYLERLEQIADVARERMLTELAGVEAIVASGLIRKDFFFLPTHLRMSLEDVVRFAYLRAWSTGIGRRKLFPGFHPGVYALHHDLGQFDDALVDWLRRGRPDGQWMSPVISDADAVLPLPASTRVALHLHVYYADLLSEMLGRIGDNRVRPDLFISVPNERVAEDVRATLAGYSGRVADVQVVPNRGRDIGPLLTAFGPALLAGYDFVGHLHTKKTADLKDENVGKNWYRFLLENLLGGKAPMADIVLGRLAADPTLGLVFPEDPNVVGWGINRPYAEAVAGALGVTELPEHFQFPVGTMFWARVESLRPMIEHGFDWSDYPAEPLPYDGSLLHALERLFPLSAEAHGFRTAVTNVAGITR
jgi:glycosyltransferase involved in cell wall biosynthesis